MGKPDTGTGHRRGLAMELDPAIVAETARRYDRCHKGDTFSDLVRRSSFSKEDRGLLEDWLAATLDTARVPCDEAAARGRSYQKPDIGEIARILREAIQLAARSP